MRNPDRLQLVWNVLIEPAVSILFGALLGSLLLGWAFRW